MKITEDLADWHRELIDERNHVGIHQRLNAEDVIRLIERTSQAEAERDEAREKLNRLNFDRTDNTSPFTCACHLLQDGFISVGKALEWWRVYVNTGNLEPIADGEGESIWDENEKLKARVKELEAQAETLTEALKIACHDNTPERRVVSPVERTREAMEQAAKNTATGGATCPTCGGTCCAGDGPCPECLR